jgi:hypothetical protein
MLLSGPITLPLPELPRPGGAGRTFTADIQGAVKEIVARLPVFAPMHVPLKVVLLVVTPRQGKDLDNLALVVLPVVQRLLNPPAITSYEVIELARAPGDPPEGHLRLALGDGLCPDSRWGRATDYVGQNLEHR